jgi:hypothetical protein
VTVHARPREREIFFLRIPLGQRDNVRIVIVVVVVVVVVVVLCLVLVVKPKLADPEGNFWTIHPIQLDLYSSRPSIHLAVLPGDTFS